MAERKLNFSAPIISARRISISKVPTEGTKSSKFSDSPHCRNRAPYWSDGHLDQITKPAAIPFNWEQIPGLPKNTAMARSRSCELPSSLYTADSRKMFDVLKQRVEKNSASRSTQKIFTVVDSYKATIAKREFPKEKLASGKVHPSCNEEDDKFSEATAALSAICSATSGVTNYDTALSNTSGRSSSDKQIQDFMMSRFLPAAQAVALQPSLSISRKPPAIVEQEKQITKLYVHRKPPAKVMECRVVPFYGQSTRIGAREDEFDDEESCVSVQITTKACGIFPRMCFKSSISFINPVSGMKSKNRPPLPPPQDSESSSRSNSKRFQSPVKKHPLPAIIAILPKQDGAVPETPNKAKFGSNQITSQNEKPSMSRTSSPLRRSGVLSAQRSTSPLKSNGSECVRGNKLPYYRGGIRSQDLSSYYLSKQWSCQIIPAMEKTLIEDARTKPEKLHKATESDANGAGRREAESVRTKRSSFEDTNRRTISPSNSRKTVEGNFRDFSKALVCVEAENMYGYRNGGMYGSSLDIPALPRLPKSPSESWLWRTIPRGDGSAIDGRASKWEEGRQASKETKWENMVKSAYPHRDHVRYSEELVRMGYRH